MSAMRYMLSSEDIDIRRALDATRFDAAISPSFRRFFAEPPFCRLLMLRHILHFRRRLRHTPAMIAFSPYFIYRLMRRAGAARCLFFMPAMPYARYTMIRHAAAPCRYVYCVA